ncbi:class III extradiol ring-cleavage dioxygenase [Terasakiella sp. SH-1]|uniref:DODA-type extradiol aromatic ring-opening family dioxygenase n=1 Tax=Terasakiella sp. SH-1 TaxID=2560057 RepID=UPI001073556A|nr:class III extradiol ring-cleavage dioxygenase [Terasakiella sp. SH-1]
MMPSLFISHGSPTVMIEPDSAGHQFLKTLGKTLPTPKAILVISAHWETQKPTITINSLQKTIHDFYGFPQTLFELDYPAPSAPELAQKVAKLVDGDLEESRGLDHGAWSPLLLMYPKAHIPVIQLSIQPHLSAQYHYDLGRKLAPLRKEGVLILASGAVTHNLRELDFFVANKPDPWAQEFEDWFVAAIERNDHEAILSAHQAAPHFQRSHPKDEHWQPIYVALGAAQQKATLLHRGFEHKNLSMASVRFD